MVDSHYDVKFLLCVHVCVCMSPVMSVGLEEPGVIEQVDLTPTLALGLGLPISQNSVGRIIPGVFEESSLRDQLRFLHLNGHQLNCLLKDSMPNYEKGKHQIHCVSHPQETPKAMECYKGIACFSMQMNHIFVRNKQLISFIKIHSW